MSEMIERIAKAIDAKLGDDHESLSIEMGFGSHARKWREEAMKEAARAAVEAMREPTEKMLSMDFPDMPAGGGPLDVWYPMIDAALVEEILPA